MQIGPSAWLAAVLHGRLLLIAGTSTYRCQLFGLNMVLLLWSMTDMDMRTPDVHVIFVYRLVCRMPRRKHRWIWSLTRRSLVLGARTPTAGMEERS